ncbi:hypothetical protein [Notoacmeibacter marinus]|uniref:hypothetical protein n=1 Tax=Notoacmeibacter marinus TaxID=1876515 RepID=UPI0013B05A96|nr:hypothetical protein [Notoacmeibacter marinus]
MIEKQCHACGGEISRKAKICHHCNSSQSKLVYRLNTFVSFGTPVISLLALLVSFAALYFSTVTEPAAPKLVVQIDRFTNSGFSFFVANVGELPSSVRDFDLTLSLQQGAGTHIVQAGFSILSKPISPGENRFFQIEYSSYLPRHTLWTSSDQIQEPFTLNFLYGAAALGNNLHCEVDIYFASQRYFPSNIEGAEGSVNGACSEAMKWFAEGIGPLKASQSSE